MKEHQYSQYPRDVAEEQEYHTEPPRFPNSTRRYRQGDFQGAMTVPVAQRSSLQSASRPSRTTGASRARREVQTQEFYRGETEKLSNDWQPPVQARPSKAVKPLPSQLQQRLQDYRSVHQGNWIRRHLAAIGGGMCTALLLIVVGWSLLAAYSNAIGDPLAYTQTAHRDAKTVVITGHHAHVVAFIGEQGHLEAVVIPDGGKPQLFEGDVVPFANPMISVEQKKNSDIIVTVRAPFGDMLLQTRPTTLSWKVPVDQKPQGK